MKRAGFSLIEVLVAMTLALVLLLGTAELVTLSISARRKGDMTAGLTQALSSRLAALKSLAHAPGGLVPASLRKSRRARPDAIFVIMTNAPWMV